MTTHDSDTVELPVQGKSTRDSKARVRVDVAGLTHPGLVRANNEDHFLIARFGRSMEILQSNLPVSAIPHYSTEIGYGMVVADGIGGDNEAVFRA